MGDTVACGVYGRAAAIAWAGLATNAVCGVRAEATFSNNRLSMACISPDSLKISPDKASISSRIRGSMPSIFRMSYRVAACLNIRALMLSFVNRFAIRFNFIFQLPDYSFDKGPMYNL